MGPLQLVPWISTNWDISSCLLTSAAVIGSDHSFTADGICHGYSRAELSYSTILHFVERLMDLIQPLSPVLTRDHLGSETKKLVITEMDLCGVNSIDRLGGSTSVEKMHLQ